MPRRATLLRRTRARPPSLREPSPRSALKARAWRVLPAALLPSRCLQPPLESPWSHEGARRPRASPTSCFASLSWRRLAQTLAAAPGAQRGDSPLVFELLPGRRNSLSPPSRQSCAPQNGLASAAGASQPSARFRGFSSCSSSAPGSAGSRSDSLPASFSSPASRASARSAAPRAASLASPAAQPSAVWQRLASLADETFSAASPGYIRSGQSLPPQRFSSPPPAEAARPALGLSLSPISGSASTPSPSYAGSPSSSGGNSSPREEAAPAAAASAVSAFASSAPLHFPRHESVRHLRGSAARGDETSEADGPAVVRVSRATPRAAGDRERRGLAKAGRPARRSRADAEEDIAKWRGRKPEELRSIQRERWLLELLTSRSPDALAGVQRELLAVLREREQHRVREEERIAKAGDARGARRRPAASTLRLASRGLPHFPYPPLVHGSRGLSLLFQALRETPAGAPCIGASGAQAAAGGEAPKPLSPAQKARAVHEVVRDLLYHLPHFSTSHVAIVLRLLTASLPAAWLSVSAAPPSDLRSAAQRAPSEHRQDAATRPFSSADSDENGLVTTSSSISRRGLHPPARLPRAGASASYLFLRDPMCFEAMTLAELRVELLAVLARRVSSPWLACFSPDEVVALLSFASHVVTSASFSSAAPCLDCGGATHGTSGAEGGASAASTRRQALRNNAKSADKAAVRRRLEDDVELRALLQRICAALQDKLDAFASLADLAVLAQALSRLESLEGRMLRAVGDRAGELLALRRAREERLATRRGLEGKGLCLEARRRRWGALSVEAGAEEDSEERQTDPYSAAAFQELVLKDLKSAAVLCTLMIRLGAVAPLFQRELFLWLSHVVRGLAAASHEAAELLLQASDARPDTREGARDGADASLTRAPAQDCDARGRVSLRDFSQRSSSFLPALATCLVDMLLQREREGRDLCLRRDSLEGTPETERDDQARQQPADASDEGCRGDGEGEENLGGKHGRGEALARAGHEAEDTFLFLATHGVRWLQSPVHTVSIVRALALLAKREALEWREKERERQLLSSGEDWRVICPQAGAHPSDEASLTSLSAPRAFASSESRYLTRLCRIQTTQARALQHLLSLLASSDLAGVSSSTLPAVALSAVATPATSASWEGAGSPSISRPSSCGPPLDFVRLRPLLMALLESAEAARRGRELPGRAGERGAEALALRLSLLLRQLVLATPFAHRESDKHATLIPSLRARPQELEWAFPLALRAAAAVACLLAPPRPRAPDPAASPPRLSLALEPQAARPGGSREVADRRGPAAGGSETGDDADGDAALPHVCSQPSSGVCESPQGEAALPALLAAVDALADASLSSLFLLRARAGSHAPRHPAAQALNALLLRLRALDPRNSASARDWSLPPKQAEGPSGAREPRGGGAAGSGDEANAKHHHPETQRPSEARAPSGPERAHAAQAQGDLSRKADEDGERQRPHADEDGAEDSVGELRRRVVDRLSSLAASLRR
ncbi:hypothetical protein BESB_030550 [Besnoitia besnoiti]|uniref:Uncharacterized protein n=1 Tax=Besnoitia besnoiti TaxID=94643 RepID=A0A2A9M4E8_BESBE|nr:hypothetical protein BESB_030550 [Besnoitia besnoiti]PFH31181.1 hypothetical protein BESB_030550 [Besnoitia besnoiti]